MRAPSWDQPGPASALSVASGVGLAVQARLNGELFHRLGPGGLAAALPAAAVSFGVGLLGLLVVLAAQRRGPEAVRRVRRARPPVWYLLGGLGGAFLVAVGAAAVPVLGVALLSVFIVAGQIVGGLAVDGVGMGPSGRQPVTGQRLAGAAVAVAAVGVGALGQGGHLDVALAALILGAGLATAAQQAANGQLQRVSADTTFASVVSFAGGTLALLAALAVHRAVAAPAALHWPAAPVLYLGGLAGAVYIAVAAATVRVLGVLRLALAVIAGQLLGSLLLDVVVPAPGARLRALTVVSVALTFGAVAVASLRRSRA